ncbi:MAG: superoxide dismutase [Prevotellaceae bacterium]|jgi:Fe-Mn family superoxide dismutase|nr:superoxide dismutase [Prevotellaceae bacterium]
MIFELPVLNFEKDALEPHISARTIEFHYGKQFRLHINNLNALIDGMRITSVDLTTLIKESVDCSGVLFCNAAQVWNHRFYFEQLSPKPKTMPEGNLFSAINKTFGSFEEFKNRFDKAAISLFGSGYAWLSQKDDGNLIITQELNAGNPIRKNYKPLLTCDVWEHAYYLDYQCRRVDYISNFWNVLDWNVIEKRIEN